MNKVLVILIVLALILGIIVSLYILKFSKVAQTPKSNETITINETKQKEEIVSTTIQEFKTHEVHISSDFNPTKITIPKNDQVIWIADSGTHTIACETDTAPINIVLNKGDTFNWRFYKEGSYFCEDKTTGKTMEIQVI